MSIKVKEFLSNFSYSFLSNFIVLLISTLMVIILPKIIGVNEYGYWQLYVLYTSYTALLHFGWNDGIYLRYGGEEYSNLDKKLFFSQFWMLVMFETLIMVSFFIVSEFLHLNIDKLFVMRMMVVCSFFSIPRGMLLFILQATNRIKEYAIVTLSEKVVYLFLIVIFLLGGIRNYKIMILADILAKFISLVYVSYKCKDIVFRRVNSFYFTFNETFENIKSGIKIAFAYVASTLIVGTVRFGIEYNWNVATFGRVSLMLSISNMMMIFINAVGLIMFPLLRRTSNEKLPQIYMVLRLILTVSLLGILISYYPLMYVLSLWLPQYIESLPFLVLLFPICLYEGKMALLLNTYFKTMRKEKRLMQVNILTFILSLLLTGIFAYTLKNLVLTVVSILFLLMFRCIISELYMSRILGIKLKADIVTDTILTAIFVISGVLFNSNIGILVYFCSYVIYLYFNKNRLREVLIFIKSTLSR